MTGERSQAGKKQSRRKRIPLRLLLILTGFTVCYPVVSLSLWAYKRSMATTTVDPYTYRYTAASIQHMNMQGVPIPNRHSSKVHVNGTIFYHAYTNPIPTYTENHAAYAVRSSSWQCSSQSHPDHQSNDHEIFGFVHVYKAAGTTIRQLFHNLAYNCHRTWLSLGKCTDVSATSIKAQNKQWKNCIIEEVADGRLGKKMQFWAVGEANYFPSTFGRFRNLTSEILLKNVDIVGGHTRLGIGDHVFSSSSMRGKVRYIMFLRDPLDRYVSGVLYQNKIRNRHETLEEVANKIKARIRHEREKDEYWSKSLSYILTPDQRDANKDTDMHKLRKLVSAAHHGANTTSSSFKAEARARLAIQNLYNYNVIMGFTERMLESMAILNHVFLHGSEKGELKHEAEAVFRKFGHIQTKERNLRTDNSTAVASDASGSTGGVQANKSHKNDVSTSAVVAELRKDKEHMLLFEEYVKYERMITDYAYQMHSLQYEAVVAKAASRR